jgi:Zn finger protein HypA/HybF involved in hydrogenase expression
MLIINNHKVSQVICVGCFKRWIAARPVDTRLDELECPQCHRIGLAIETGETSTAEDLLQKAIEAVSR